MASETTEEELAKLAEHAASEKYHNAFRYREEDRPAHSVDNVSTAQLGHMLDTLNDALIIMRRMGDNPHIDVSRDPAYEPMESRNPVLPYLNKIASDPRNASSYARTDLERLQESKEEPDLADLSNRLHGLLRLQAHLIGQTFRMPDSVKLLAAEYEAIIYRYTTLLDAHKNPQNGKRDYTRIPAQEMDAYAAAYKPVADKLFSALRELKAADVEIEGKPYSLRNDKPINDRLEDSFPALVLFGASIFSKGVADRNKRPGLLEFEGRFRVVLGAESLLTDTAQFLGDLARNGEKPCTLPDFDRKAVKNMLPVYLRSLQLALAFCRTADCGYDKLYEDLKLFITMAGAEPELGGLRNQQEASLMLHAVDRRFAHDDIEPALQKTLRGYADTIGNGESFDLMREKCGRDMQFQRTLQRSREIAEEHGMIAAVATLAQIQAFIPPARGTGAHIGTPATRHDRLVS